MLRIHRQYRHVPFRSHAHDEFSGSDKGLLVGKRHYLAGPDGRNYGLKSAESHHRRKDYVHIPAAYEVAYGLHPCEHFHIAGTQGVSHLGIPGFITDDHIVRVELNRLLDKERAAVVGREQFHLEKVPVLAYDIKGLPSYGTRGAENRYPSFFHLLRN